MVVDNEVIENKAAELSSEEEENENENEISDEEEQSPDQGISSDFNSDPVPGESSEDSLNRNVENDKNVRHVKNRSDGNSDSSVEEPVPDEGRDLEVDIVEPITSVEDPELDGVSHVIC